MKNTSLCYIESNGQYLMLHRTKKKNDENAGKWIGVGGKFEEGESPEECMLREVYEETGLTLNSWRFRGIVTFSYSSWETEYMHLFTADSFSGEVQECSEGELKWIKKDDVLSLPIWDGDRVFLNLLKTDVPFFSLKLRYDDNGELQKVLLDGTEIEF